jgi:hypothetical protein
MAKQTTDFRIASQEIKAAKVIDLMLSGTGIPWEDRGSRGFLSAFFATVFAMMFSPVKTLGKLRRPETSTDAKIFSYAIAGVWFIAYCLQSTFSYYFFYNNNNDPRQELFGQQYVINTALGAVLCAAAAIVLSRVVTWMFYRLTAFDMTTKAPTVLVYNCIVYLMSPSILAIIPGGPKPWLMIAPCIVGLWIFIALMAVAISHLRIGIGASIIGSFLTLLATTAIVVVGIAVINLTWDTLLDKGSVEIITPTSLPR